MSNFTNMKDNFSKHAGQYAKFRPAYPQEMITYIVSLAENKNCALDVATGNGQVAVQLANYFREVQAIDISPQQLENATQKSNITYSRQPAENTDFNNAQFDLITVAQALHWFDFDAFYKEIYRILKPDGIFAVMGYGLFYTNPDTDRIMKYFYEDITGPYWDPERRYLDENYTTIPFPFKEMEAPKFTNEFIWTFEQLTGYLETWSGVQHYIKHHNTNPLNIVREDLRISWEKSDRKVYFPLLLRIGKLN